MSDAARCPATANASGLARCFKQFTDNYDGVTVALVLAQWQQPLAQVRLHRHKSAPRTFRFDLPVTVDQTALEINLVPIETLNLGAAQTGKQSDRNNMAERPASPLPAIAQFLPRSEFQRSRCDSFALAVFAAGLSTQ